MGVLAGGLLGQAGVRDAVGPGLSGKKLAGHMCRGYWAVKLEKRLYWDSPRWCLLGRFGVEVKSEADLQRVEMGSLGKGKFCLVDFSGPAGPSKKVPTWPEWGWGEQGLFKVMITTCERPLSTPMKSAARWVRVTLMLAKAGKPAQRCQSLGQKGVLQGPEQLKGPRSGSLEDLGAIQRG